MSKELVISANRHETKVALIEDDQLCEVYFQRANEYSLAGSIHKGRVTRVLPGMQSAFVDLGLERDTFLYVSDFLEEHDDFDKITGDERPPRPLHPSWRLLLRKPQPCPNPLPPKSLLFPPRPLLANVPKIPPTTVAQTAASGAAGVLAVAGAAAMASRTRNTRAATPPPPRRRHNLQQSHPKP